MQDHSLTVKGKEILMKSYTEQEFIELVASRPDINFLAAAITPWHALGIEAAILQMTEQGKALRGYIMVVAHNVTGTALSENNFPVAENNGIQIVCITPQKEIRTLKEKLSLKYRKYKYFISLPKEKDTDILYWATPLKPSYEMIPRIAEVTAKKMQFIITDEGLGSYLNSAYDWWRLSFFESGLKSGIRATWNLMIRDPFFQYSLRKRDQLQWNQLLIGKRKKWRANNAVVKYYQRILRVEEKSKEYDYYGKSILINSDMLFESGLIKENEDVKIYDYICQQMQKECIPVVLKLHPREKRLERYQAMNCRMEQKNKLAQEVILASLEKKPYCIVGTASTSLVTAKLLFDIDAISINYLMDKTKITDKKTIFDFNDAFEDLIYMPRSNEELIDHIRRIRSNYERKSTENQ